MSVYAESNYILELALYQEQAVHCRQLLAAYSGGQIELAIPSFCFAEPVQTIGRRASDRSQLQAALDRTLDLLARTKTHRDEVERLRGVTGLLARANEAERHELRVTLQDLIRQATILELSAPVLSRAQDIEVRFDLHLGDAIDCATILCDLDARPTESACFVTHGPLPALL